MKCVNPGCTRLIAFLTLAIISTPPALFAGTHSWTGASGDGKWSTAFNWASSSPPASGEAASVILVFPPAGSKNTTNDIANLTVDQIQVTGDNYQISAMGAGTNLNIRQQIVGTAFFLTGSNATFNGFQFNLMTNITASIWISVGDGDTATMRSRFTGEGGLQKLAAGTLRLQGGAPNTYLGETLVAGGNLELNHTSNAIPGNLIVGNPSLSTTGTVTMSFQNQIADTADVTVNPNGVLNFAVYTERFNSLTLSNVNQSAGIGLSLATNLISHGQSSLGGILQLAGVSIPFDVQDGTLTVNSAIDNTGVAAGFVKYGAGTLELAQTNEFNATSRVYAGKVKVLHTGALGSANVAMVVSPGAALEVNPNLTMPTHTLSMAGFGIATNGALILHHNSTWTGTLQINTTETAVSVPETNAVATLNATITGTLNFTKLGEGTLRLAGSAANTLTGDTIVKRGVLQLGKPAGTKAIAGDLFIGEDIYEQQTAKVMSLANEQIADNVAVLCDASGLLDLNGFSETVGPLTFRRSSIQTGAGVLTLTTNVQGLAPAFLGQGGATTITGTLALGGATRTFDLDVNGGATLTGSIVDGSGTSGILLTGDPNAFLILKSGPNTYTGPTTIQNGILWLQDGATPGAAAGGTSLLGESRLLIDNTVVGNESLTINVVSNWQYTLYGNVQFFRTNSWAGPVSLQSDLAIYSEFSNYRMTFGGSITGPGGLRKNNSGTVELAGTDNNLFAGALTVDLGTVELNKSGGASAVSSPVVIGNGDYNANASVLRLKASNQILDTAPITIEKSGKLDVDQYNEVIGPLTMGGGTLWGTFGMATLSADVLCRGTNPISQVACLLSLGGLTRNFLCQSNNTLYCSSNIQDGGAGAGVTKTGPGILMFGSPNSYSGTTTVKEGLLALYTTFATPGNTTGGTIVHSNATLQLQGAQVAGESLTLYGNSNESVANLDEQGSPGSTSAWDGPIQLVNEVGLATDPSTVLRLGGVISGDGFRHKSSGTIRFTGTSDNTFTGTARELTGALQLQKTNAVSIPGNLQIDNGSSVVYLNTPEQISDNSSVLIRFGAELDLNGNAETIASLEGSPTASVNDVTNTLRLTGALPTTFSGTINGGGGGAITNLVKTGSGTQTLSGHSTFNGRTVIGGALNLLGSLSNSAVTVQALGTLGGKGTIASLTGLGGKIAPNGTGNSPYGKLTSLGSVNLGSSSLFLVDLGGTNAGVDCDQLEMLGGVLTIPGCSLVVTQNYAGAISNQHTILNVVAGGASMGTFTGLAENATLISSSGQNFRINYVAGLGNNDIVLTQLSVPAPAGPPAFTSVIPLGNGAIQLNGLGDTNAQYTLLANTNLSTTNWISLGVLTATNGVLQFTDQTATNYPTRFYRLLSQ